MRPKERIPVFLELIDWPKLQNRWNTNYNHTFFINEVEKYWLENYDQRIGQVLINLNLIPNKMNIWLDEEHEILIDQGIEPREVLYWTSYYDKNKKPLKEPIIRLIKELETDHIRNIIKRAYDQMQSLPKLYEKALRDELEMRIEKSLNLREIQ